jgi:hypothetical protein
MRRCVSAPHRRVTLDGQRFDPGDEEARLYPTFFCRNCGQEHHPVVITEEAGMRRVLPRDIDETPLDDPDSAEKPGYLMPEPENDEAYSFTGARKTIRRNGLRRLATAASGCAAHGVPIWPRN